MLSSDGVHTVRQESLVVVAGIDDEPVKVEHWGNVAEVRILGERGSKSHP